MRVVVTGSEGFIGAAVVAQLLARGDEVVGVDNLSGSARIKQGDYKLHQFNLASVSEGLLAFALKEADAVIHLAAEACVAAEPLKVYETNVRGSCTLLSAMRGQGIKRLVFASSAAVYGNPGSCRVHEKSHRAPISAYGESKLIVEQMLEWTDLDYTALRYFNVCGAGEQRRVETHLIPKLIDAALNGSHFTRYGFDNYERDYVHISDVARATVMALDSGCTREAFNIGSGIGRKRSDVMAEVERVTGAKIKFKTLEPRKQDPVKLVPFIDKARTVLGWTPLVHDLGTMVRDAVEFRKQQVAA